MQRRLTSRTHMSLRRFRSLAVAAAAVVGVLVVPQAGASTVVASARSVVPPKAPATFLVGADAEDITPPQSMIDTKRFFLGGFGIGSSSVGLGPAQAPIPNGRPATG